MGHKKFMQKFDQNLRSLTKSNLTAFRQCPKRLWFEVYRRRDVANAPDAKRRMAEGGEIGEIARANFNHIVR